MAGMNFLVLGAGFSGLAAIEAVGRLDPQAGLAGTSRDSERVRELEKRGVTAHIFDGRIDHDLETAIEAATHILVSIAPGETGDAVLNAAAPHIERAQNLQWLGYYSTIGVYGDANGAWIDETWPVQALNPRIAWRLEAENGWRALAQARGTPLAILRLAGIYGPGRSPFDKLRNGVAHRIVKPGQVFNRIHVSDIGEITARAAQKRLPGIFNLADDEPAPPQDVITHAAALLGVTPPPEIDFASAELSPMARSFYAGNRRVRNTRVKDALDYRLHYPSYREGLAAILAAERGR